MIKYINTNDRLYGIDDFFDLASRKEELRCKIEIVDDVKLYIFNYMVVMPDTFDTPLSREFRGTVFDENGNCICRPFHKFFNIGEKEFTQPNNIDWDLIDYASPKIDGSIMIPVLINDKIFWKSKKSFKSYIVEMMLKEIRFSDYFMKRLKIMLQSDMTPMYEYATPNNQIVIKYDKPQLQELAIRSIQTGVYHSFPRNFGFNNISFYRNKKCIDIIKTMEDCEGVVLFNGFKNDFYKIKTQWYLDRHHMLDQISYRHVINMILDETIDDVISSLNLNQIGEKRIKNINELIREVNGEKLEIINAVEEVVYSIKSIKQSEQAAVKYIKNCIKKDMQNFVFKRFRDRDYSEDLNKHLRYKYFKKYSGKIFRMGE